MHGVEVKAVQEECSHHCKNLKKRSPSFKRHYYFIFFLSFPSCVLIIDQKENRFKSHIDVAWEILAIS